VWTLAAVTHRDVRKRQDPLPLRFGFRHFAAARVGDHVERDLGIEVQPDQDASSEHRRAADAGAAMNGNGMTRFNPLRQQADDANE